MAITFYSEDVEFPKLSLSKTKAWLKAIAKSYNKRVGNISYIFCSDEYLLNMNKEFLSHDYYTDIITFNYCDVDLLSGDMFISIDRINDNATVYDSADTELYRVIVHGLLHLIGFNDHSETEQKIMRQQENNALKKLGINSSSRKY